MYDNIELTDTENIGTPQVQMRLKPNLPKELIPLGLFENSETESMFKAMNWFCDRVFPEERVDCKELLEDLGLDRYDPWEIVKLTRGTLMTDGWWLKVHSTDTYEKHSLRGAAGYPAKSFESKKSYR